MTSGRLAALLLALFLVSAPVQSAERLSESQIRGLAPGHYVGMWKSKTSLNLRLDRDGKIYGTVKGVYRSGKWFVDNGKFCLTFSILFISKTECGDILRDGGWYIGLFKKGKPRLRMRQV